MLLEIDYLKESKKIETGAETILKFIEESRHLKIAEDSYTQVVQKARSISWTRDAFDRLIVGHAHLHKLPLLTKDRKIREHYSKAIW